MFATHDLNCITWTL